MRLDEHMPNTEYITQRIDQIRQFILNHEAGLVSVNREGFSASWNLDSLQKELKSLENQLANAQNPNRNQQEANFSNAF